MIISNIQKFFEKLDSYRNELLYLFIKPYWPRWILPNHITWVRVIFGILLSVLLFWFGIEDKFLIVSLFCIGALTDFIDGPVARGTNKVTEFGAMLDSTADRILIIPIAVYSLFSIHKWLLLILLLVEVLNTIVSILYKSKEIYMESNIYGKVKMVLQSIVFVVILFAWPHSPFQFFIDILWLTIPLSLLSIFARLVEMYPSKLKTISKL
jgi:phosphatidylglycerophosphate synthase